MKIKVCAVSDVGKERTNNEDAVAVCPDLFAQSWDECITDEYRTQKDWGSLVVVADGMGGANAGEIASSLAIGSIKASFSEASLSRLEDKTQNSIHDFLVDTFHTANNSILDYLLTEPESIGMGTTLVLLWLLDGYAHIAWCGDSRCYCFNPQNGLSQITKDHSLVQEMVDKGEIKPSAAFNHPDNNIITRCLGDVNTLTEPDIVSYKVNRGDIFLLCSDGLCGFCTDTALERAMYDSYDRLETCQNKLLQMALNAGGQDNITISLCATLPDSEMQPHLGLKVKAIRNFNKLLGRG